MGSDRYHIHKYISPNARNAEMPIPPVLENMEIFNAGAVSIGVEFRVLTDELIASLGVKVSPEIGTLNDQGVSLHVFVKAEDGDLERLRFDCFDEDPHYHYISWRQLYNDWVYIDPALQGDVLNWCLNVMLTRLPWMLEKAGVENAAELVDSRRLEDIWPRVTEAAYRARFYSNKDRIIKETLAVGERMRG